MKFKLAHWEIVLFIFANLICAINYILPILLIAGLFMLADLATTPGNSIRTFKIWPFILAITVIIDILTLLCLKNMAFAIILSLSGFTFAYLTAFILFAIEKRIKKHAKISQYQ